MKVNGGKYRTVTKYFNKLLCHIEHRQKKIKLRSFPYLYIIDIGNICNLQCPLCPTGTSSSKRKRQFMCYENYIEIFDKFKKYAYWVFLCNWGEPFLNKDLFKIIDYTKKNNVGVILSTNFNMVTDEMLESVVKLEVDRLTLSIDGSNQDSYEKYRKNGDFEKVLSNLKKLLFIKQESKSEYPVIVWQYLVSKKNEKFVPEARRLAKDLGVEIEFPKFILKHGITFKNEKIDKKLIDEWITDESQKNINSYTFKVRIPCEHLFFSMIVNPEGSTSPCCAVHDSKTDFGDLLNDDLETLWNNGNYLSARSLFSNKDIPGKKKVICDDCAAYLTD